MAAGVVPIIRCPKGAAAEMIAGMSYKRGAYHGAYYGAYHSAYLPR